MAYVDRAGRFRGLALGWTIQESQELKLPMFLLNWAIEEYLNPQTAQWEDWRAFDMRIMSRSVLFKKDGTVNEKNRADLMDVFPWDGLSMASLNDGDWSEVRAQLTIEAEEYQGKTRFVVQWVNPFDWEGFSLEKTEPKEVAGIASRWDMKLRAVAGPQKPKAAAVPVAATTAAAAKKPAGGPPVRTDAKLQAALAIQTAKDAAWRHVLDGSKNNEELAMKNWESILMTMYPGKADDALTAADWLAVSKAEVIPF